MGTIVSQITSLTIVFSTVYSDADQRKDQSSASLAFVQGIYRGPVNSPHKWPVTRKMLPFDDVIMKTQWAKIICYAQNCTNSCNIHHTCDIYKTNWPYMKKVCLIFNISRTIEELFFPCCHEIFARIPNVLDMSDMTTDINVSVSY